jgi:hypothetical protein
MTLNFVIIAPLSLFFILTPDSRLLTTAVEGGRTYGKRRASQDSHRQTVRCPLSDVRCPWPIATVASSNASRYYTPMADLKLDVPVTEEVEVDAETLAAIDEGIADAEAGRTVPAEEVRKLIPQWISKFESQKPR